jgi:glycosyltransferase involved in cell wall biosynthesis
MGALVFVTEELSPFNLGETGRVIYNILKSLNDDDRKRSCIILLDGAIDQAHFSAIFPSIRLILIDSNDESGRFEAFEHHPPRSAYSYLECYWKSTVVYRALRRLACKEQIDYIEFPDTCGLGFASVQEKKISGFLQNTCLAVRLHSAYAMRFKYESRLPYLRDLNLVDLERKTLRDCDLVVGQLSSIAEATRKVFGFSLKEWTPRLITHAPPILRGAAPVVSTACVPSFISPILLGADTPSGECSELFVKGVNAFCNLHPEYDGDILQPDRSNKSSRLGRESKSVKLHEALISRSVCVFPSDFESFCLAAYEASSRGALVVVNAKNPAFGDGTPWQDGVNCVKFDGTALGLVKALERSFTLETCLSAVSILNDPWPWTKFKLSDRRAFCRSSETPLVSVLIPHFNGANYLPATLASVRAQTYPNIEIILVDDHSTEQESKHLVERLASQANDKFTVITTPAELGLAGTRNFGVTAARGKYLLPLDADDLLEPRFLAIAVEALECNPEFAAVVTQAAYFKNEEPIRRHSETRDHNNYDIFIGECLIGGFRSNRFSTATTLFRTEIIRSNPYYERLGGFEDWNLYFRLVQSGYRFLVTTGVYFFYRDRRGSMAKRAQRDAKYAVYISNVLRTAIDMERVVPLAYLGHCVAFAEMATSRSWRIINNLRRAKSNIRPFLQGWSVWLSRLRLAARRLPKN